jgi:2-hydroxy-3-oxopropionate reductase
LPVTAVVAEIHRSFLAAGLGAEDNAALMRQFDGPRENSPPR